MAIKCPNCEHVNPDDTLFCGKCGARIRERVPDSPASGSRAVESADQPSPAPKIPPSGLKDQVFITRTLETGIDELTRGMIFAGRYEIIEELGAGGMGRVYRAFDKKIEEEVAIKLLKPEIAVDRRVVERFRNEIKTARKIRHANVCGMYDLQEEGKTLFFTMEYVRGEDLKNVIRRMGTLTTGKAISIARQIAEGLGEAHRLGVAHRDLKPGNIMIDKDGNAKIMDFGIARSLAGAGTTAEGVIIGTPEYMSPEQVEGKPADQRADIYALGVILFEMVTGRPPFDGETALAVAHKHKYDPPPDPRTLNPQIPANLSRVILRCLEKKRETRYQMAEEFLADIAAVESALPTAERAPARRPLTRRKPSISREITVKLTPARLLIPAVALASLVIAVLLVRRLTSGRPATPYPTDRPSLAILYFQNNTGDKSLDHWSTGLSDLLIYKLSQSKFLYILPKDRLLSVLNLLGLQDARSYSAEDIKKLASRKIGKYLLSGSYFKSGENFQLHLTLQDSGNGKVLDVLSDECHGEAGISSLIDRLSPKIKGALEVSEAKIAADIDRSLGEITTSSPEALKFFSEGTSLYLRGKYVEAIEKLKMALAVDPDFTMAYRHMAALHDNMGRRVEGAEFMQKALALKDRASERERLLIEGNDYLRKGQYENVVEVLTKLLERWPEDILGNRILGSAFGGLGDQDSAFKLAKRGFRFYPESAVECCNLADCYWQRGEFNKAEKILLAYAKNFPDSPMVHGYLSWHYHLTNEFDRALQEWEMRQRLDPKRDVSWMKLDLYFSKGDLAACSQMAARLLESESVGMQVTGRGYFYLMDWAQGRYAEAKSSCREILTWAAEDERAKEMRTSLPYFHLDLASLCLNTGDFKDALDESNEALRVAAEIKDVSAQMQALVFKGKALLALKSFDEARKTAEELLLTLKDVKNKRMIKIHHLLEGLIDLESGHLKKAVERLEKAESLLLGNYGMAWNLNVADNAVYLDALAQAYYRSGKLSLAKAKYEKISSTGLFRFKPDIWAKSFYWLGRIAEEQGKKAEARGHYGRFLDLWKDADPGLLEVEDAKKRLKEVHD